MTDKRKDEIKTAREILGRLCSGKGHDVSWKMSIPVHQDDSDMVLSRVIDRADISPPVADDVAEAALKWFNFIMECCHEKIHECEASRTIRSLLRAASTPSAEAQAVSEVTVEELSVIIAEEISRNPLPIDYTEIGNAPAKAIAKYYPNGIKIKSGGE